MASHRCVKTYQQCKCWDVLKEDNIIHSLCNILHTVPAYRLSDNVNKQAKVIDNQEKNVDRNRHKDDPESGASRQRLENIMTYILKKREEKTGKK